MRAYLATNVIGVFAFDQDKKLLGHRLFPKKVDVITEKMDAAQKGEVLPEERDLIRDLMRLGYKEIVWDKDTKEKGTMFVYKADNLGKKTLQEEYRRLAIELHWVSSQAELNDILSKINISLTKDKLQVAKKDKIIMRAVGVLDEIDKTVNVFSEMLREWYGLYFPEASKVIGENDKYAEAVYQFGNREKIKNHRLARYADKSSGMDFSDEDIRKVQSFAEEILNIFKEKKVISEYVEGLCKGTVPNLTSVAGPLLAARLLALAGGIEKLARLPSSTIQLLGAEKALFRHLKGGGKAPKYGIIFSHPFIQKASKEQKGKAARLVSAKLSMAAKIDCFSGEDKGDELKKQLEEQIEKNLKIKV